MNIKDYISSGILELYSSGALSPDESAEAEVMIKKYPEVRKEYENILKSFLLLTSIKQKSPGDSVKSSLLKKINLDGNANTALSQTEPKNLFSKSYSYLLAASIVFLIISLAANLYLLNDIKEYENRISALNDKIKLMTQDFESVNNKLVQSSGDMKIATDKNYKMIELKGLEKSPGLKAIAFWNPVSKKVYIKVESLPIPPVNRRYQLWAIQNGNPQDLGMMDVDPSDTGLHEMKNTDGAQAFAITLEPKTGSTNPTMSEMYAMGEI